MEAARDFLLSHGPAPLAGLFLAFSFLMLWRLDAMGRKGLEGTVIGTVFMPYASGAGNLFFVYAMLRVSDGGGEVVVNALVNNMSNLTLLLGLPALIWGLRLLPAKGRSNASIPSGVWNRLSILLTLGAGLFFTAMVWALGRDGELGFGDGLALCGVFVFWQVFQAYDVLKSNLTQNRRLPYFSLAVDVLIVIGSGVGMFFSVEYLVAWLDAREGSFFSGDNMGWLTGWLMVIPNALLAFYYAQKRRSDIVYSSQAGDGHICVPLCIGLFALVQPIPVTGWLLDGCRLLMAVTVVHLVLVLLFRGLPRWTGLLLVGAYGVFLYLGWVD